LNVKQTSAAMSSCVDLTVTGNVIECNFRKVKSTTLKKPWKIS
jgi:hypothetical protein